MKTSIIILNWNGGENDCSESVRSALSQHYENKEIVFIDNGSIDGSGEAIKESFPEITFLRLDENIGCPPGRNFGASHAKGDLLFFLENDGVWDNENLVSSTVQFFEDNPQVGAVYTRVEGYKTGVPDDPLDPQPAAAITNGVFLSSSFRGGASIIRSSIFRECGGFPVDYFRQGEERFLSLLIYQYGYKVVYWPEFSLRHKGSDYQGKAAIVSSFNVENNLKTILRLYPILPAVLIGFPKWSVGMFRLFRYGLWREALGISKRLLLEVFTPRQFKRVSTRCFREVESLRQGAVQHRNVSKKSEPELLSRLIVRRLFLKT